MIVLLRSEATRYSVSIRTDLAENLPKSHGADRVQLQQVFMNLMTQRHRCHEATADGGELTIKSEASRWSTADLGQ